MAVVIKIEDDGQAEQFLDNLERKLRGPALDKALKAAGKVVKNEALPNIPRSSDTGTRELWSAALRGTRAGVKPHADSIGVLVRQYTDAFVLVVGAQYPAGALAHLIEGGHELVAWGQPTNHTVPGHPYLEPAAEATQQQQTAEFLRVLRRETGVED